jgi:hypothetical protein
MSKSKSKSVSISENLVELSLDELSAVRGAQTTQRTAGDALSDQFDQTLKAWGDFVAPVVAPVRETVKLAYAADQYLKFTYEHQYPTLSQAHGDKVNQDKADKASHDQQEHDKMLSGDKPTNAGQVATWLDSTQGPPAPPIEYAFPTYMTEPPHEATISIEPLDNYNDNGGGLY